MPGVVKNKKDQENKIIYPMIDASLPILKAIETLQKQCEKTAKKANIDFSENSKERKECEAYILRQASICESIRRRKLAYYCMNHSVKLPIKSDEIIDFKINFQAAYRKESDKSKKELNEYITEYVNWLKKVPDNYQDKSKKEKEKEKEIEKVVKVHNDNLNLIEKIKKIELKAEKSLSITRWEKACIALGFKSFGDVRKRLDSEWKKLNVEGDQDCKLKEEFLNSKMNECKQEDVLIQQGISIGMGVLNICAGIGGIVSAPLGVFIWMAGIASAASGGALIAQKSKSIGELKKFGCGIDETGDLKEAKNDLGSEIANGGSSVLLAASSVVSVVINKNVGAIITSCAAIASAIPCAFTIGSAAKSVMEVKQKDAEETKQIASEEVQQQKKEMTKKIGKHILGGFFIAVGILTVIGAAIVTGGGALAIAGIVAGSIFGASTIVAGAQKITEGFRDYQEIKDKVAEKQVQANNLKFQEVHSTLDILVNEKVKEVKEAEIKKVKENTKGKELNFSNSDNCEHAEIPVDIDIFQTNNSINKVC